MRNLEPTNGKFLFGGVLLSREEISSTERNGKKYVVHLNNGTTVEYKKQKNKKIQPGISGYAENDKVTTSIYNLSGANIKGAQNKSDDMYLFACRKCDIDLSDAYPDKVTLSEDQFAGKSELNKVIYSNTDIIVTDTFTKTTEGVTIQPVSLKFYEAGTVKQSDLLR